MAGIACHGHCTLGPWTLGPRTLGPMYSKSLGPRGRGPKVLGVLGPRPLGPWDLRYLGLKVWGPKVRGLKAQGLMALESNLVLLSGVAVLQEYRRETHIANIAIWVGNHLKVFSSGLGTRCQN